ncbi:ABC transporter ATP-binding protein [Paracoccus liaowanqingii]|uniref:ABC transporter ATP-binding protein n=1 Tax=Paracoccus liaowanqingii TaxID=2560053 RepID=A0A4P7HIW5_9RHOB|nr:ABC transporter ATP-binding protein [Paracoccus liaowanqingii]QBX33996.1 ABC transporter ATP-binding protein [Paracoccus liaowanqingii]
MSHSVELAGIGMTFGTTRAVSDVTFKVAAGEFFSILGPSGCGKTTILRMIAGFIEPTEGHVLIGERDMAGLGPDQRPTAMIFQSLALFPLMSVRDNIAFGLEARGMSRPERRAKADDLLRLIALEGYGDRMPGELSGGQRQRVAIARALAVEPGVLLLDEPLSALDLKLRQHMRAELRALQKRTGVTFIYITHDQSEALAMSDRVAVMSNGLLQQVASPRALYDNPATPFVARFVGETNAIPGRIAQVQDGHARIDTALGSLTGRAGQGALPGQPGTIYIRPEALMPGGTENSLTAGIERVDFEGSFALVHGRFDGGEALAASVPSTRLAEAPEPGSRATFGFAPGHAVVLGDG